MPVTKSRPKTKRPSNRKSIRRSAFYDAVNKYLVNQCNWQQNAKNKLSTDPRVGSLKRAHAKDMVTAVVNVLISNSNSQKGCSLPGLGKLYWKYRKPRTMGEVTRFGTTMMVAARPASWTPRFRLAKAGKRARPSSWMTGLSSRSPLRQSHPRREQLWER